MITSFVKSNTKFPFILVGFSDLSYAIIFFIYLLFAKKRRVVDEKVDVIVIREATTLE